MVKHGEERSVRRGLSSEIHVISFGLVCWLSEARTVAVISARQGFEAKGGPRKVKSRQLGATTSIIGTIPLKAPK